MPDPSTPANEASLRAGPSTPTNEASLRARWAREVRTRLSSLRLSPARETEIVEELSQHLDDRWRELIAGGALPDESTRLTLAEFRDGDVLARYMAPLRQAHVPPPMTPGAPTGHVLTDLWQDLRYARRTMAARPSFTAVAVLSLALGIGANTAIFSLWNGVLYASLPAVHEPEQLVILSNPDASGLWNGGWDSRTDGPRSWLTYGEFEQLRDNADVFSAVMASQSSLNTWQVRIEGGGWEDARGRLVSGGFFQGFGVSAVLGRVFTTVHDRAEIPEAVMSHRYWQRRFSGRSDVIGKTLTVRNTVVTIIGVAPPGFVGETSGQQPDLWLPLQMQPRVLPGTDRLHDTPPSKVMWLQVFGRLKPGVTLAQADAQANTLFRAGLESFYGAGTSGERRREDVDQRLLIQPGARGASPARHEFSQSLTALLAGVGVLLLIACANLANLLLARGAARMPEMAVRLSLGASRGRLVRQLVTESLALAAMGGAAAVAVAYVLHGPLVRMMAESDPDFRMSFTLEPVGLVFVLTATVAAALVLGALPAWQVTRTDTGARLREQSRGVVGSIGQMRSGRFLVSVQLALSLPLLVGAGLLAQTAYNLQRADLGFPAGRVLLVRIDVREAAPDAVRRAGVVGELLEQFRRLPDVQAASFSRLGVFSGGNSINGIEVEGYAPRSDADRYSAVDVVGPRYFSTLGIPILLGREILETDGGDAPKVCVINEAFARRFFDGRNPLGLRIAERDDDDTRTDCQVAGVARNARTQLVRGEIEPRYFVALRPPSSSGNTPTFMIRTRTDETASVMTAVRKAIERVDAAIAVLTASSIEDEMAPLTAQDRMTAQLAAAFGGVALTLAAIGLYGVLSCGIARRTGEIAIRIALGAPSGRVVSMILGETVGLIGVGLAVGGGLAYAASGLIDSRLYGVAAHDPLTLALATALLLLVALSAAYVPAQRASRLDPISALRQQ